MVVEGGAEPVQVEVNGGNGDRSEFARPVLRREPSFSWFYDENGVEHVESLLRNSKESVEDGAFDLPLPQTDSVVEEGGLHRLRQPLGPFCGRNLHMNGNGKNYVSFDIENSPAKELQVSVNNNVDGSCKINSDHHDQNGVTPGMVLKTLFFILMWYAPSTCLTLYNKALLGEHLGKFPAPLPMNTVHFSMQTVFSRIIVRYSRKLQPDVIMPWRDYFIRVVPAALGTGFDVNLSNASLVFISVTFATMCKSAAPIFLLLFAFAFRLESPSFKLLGIILVISFGVLLTGFNRVCSCLGD